MIVGKKSQLWHISVTFLKKNLLQNASKGSELAASGCKTWDLEFQLPKKLFRKVPVKM